MLESYRDRSGQNYDCIIPVSGGKDSTYQVIRMLELDMTPLCVTATTDELSEVGRRNIENLQLLGVDHVAVTTNPRVRRRIPCPSDPRRATARASRRWPAPRRRSHVGVAVGVDVGPLAVAVGVGVAQDAWVWV